MNNEVNISVTMDFSGLNQGISEIQRQIATMNQTLQDSFRETNRKLRDIVANQRLATSSTDGLTSAFSRLPAALSVAVLREFNDSMVATSTILGTLKGVLKKFWPLLVATSINDLTAGFSRFSNEIGGNGLQAAIFGITSALEGIPILGPLIGNAMDNIQSDLARSALKGEMFAIDWRLAKFKINWDNEQLGGSFKSFNDVVNQSLTTDRIERYARVMGVSFDDARASLEETFGTIDLLSNDFMYKMQNNTDRFNPMMVSNMTTEAVKELANELEGDFDEVLGMLEGKFGEIDLITNDFMHLMENSTEEFDPMMIRNMTTEAIQELADRMNRDFDVTKDMLERNFGEINTVMNDFLHGINTLFSDDDNDRIFYYMSRLNMTFEEARAHLAEQYLKAMMDSQEFRIRIGQAMNEASLSIRDESGNIITDMETMQNRVAEVYTKMIHSNTELGDYFHEGRLRELIMSENGSILENYNLTREELLSIYYLMSGDYFRLANDMVTPEMRAKWEEAGLNIYYPLKDAEGNLIGPDGVFLNISGGLESLARDFAESNLSENADMASQETIDNLAKMYTALKAQALDMGFEIDELGNVIGPYGPLGNIREAVANALEDTGRLQEGAKVDFERVKRYVDSNLSSANSSTEYYTGKMGAAVARFHELAAKETEKAATSMGDNVSDGGRNMAEALASYTDEATNIVSNATTEITEEFSNQFGTAIPYEISNAFTKSNGINDTIYSELDNVNETVSNALDDTVDLFRELPSNVVNMFNTQNGINLASIGAAIKNNIIDGLDGLADRLAATIQAEIARAERLVSQDVARLRNMTPTATRMFDGAVSGLEGLIGNVLDPIGLSRWTPDSLAMAYAPVGMFSAHSQAMDDVFRNQSNRNAVLEEGMEILIDEVKALRSENNQLKIYLDSGQLVGGIVNELDTELQRNANFLKRGITPPYRR